MPDRETVITHLQIIHTWAEFARERDLQFFTAKHLEDIAQWSADAIALLKEQEVKTGKWIERIDYMGDTYYDCSVCNESWITIEGTPWVNGMNYCPHCGAKMEFEGR